MLPFSACRVDVAGDGSASVEVTKLGPELGMTLKQVAFVCYVHGFCSLYGGCHRRLLPRAVIEATVSFLRRLCLARQRYETNFDPFVECCSNATEHRQRMPFVIGVF